MKERGAWFFAALWLVTALWATAQVVRAGIELAREPEVVGLFRHFKAPYQHHLGWVIDPRKGSIWDEIQRRYDVEMPESWPKVVDFDGFSQALSSLELTYEVGPGDPRDGLSPRVRGIGAHAHILLRKFGVQWVLFYPQVGVLLSDELPAAEWTVTLTDCREPPW